MIKAHSIREREEKVLFLKYNLCYKLPHAVSLVDITVKN